MKDIQDREIRVSSSSFEIRAGVEKPDAESRTVRGYAAKFGTVSEPLMSRDSKYKFRETIAKGAFDGASMDDCRALFNHDANFILARSKDGKGTLKLGVDNIGLWYQFEAPNSTVGNDLLEAIRRGDIDQSSFAFRIAEGGAEWKETGTSTESDPVIYLRTITKISRVFDVSPVTEPAYADTSVAVRAIEAMRCDPSADPGMSKTEGWAKRFGF